MNLKSWLLTARLRTLPLSLSAVAGGILLGLGEYIGADSPAMRSLVAILILMTAVFLQILSNFANDYGDAISGLDNAERVGPLRSLGQGLITRQELRWHIVVLAIVSVLFGATAVFMAFHDNLWAIAGFGALGLLAVGAAITYTIGLVYGYHGFGDIAVFIFFGLVAVLGSEYMTAGGISCLGSCFGALAGFTSILVLNVNNLRDYENDRVSGKHSIAVRLGVRGGKIYHAVLLILSLFCFLLCLIGLYDKTGPVVLLAFIVSVPLIKSSCFCINPVHVNGELDIMLKRTSLSAALINLCLGLLFYFFI